MRGRLGSSPRSVRTMDRNEQKENGPQAALALVNRISVWLKKAGVQDSEVRATLAIALADFLDAARTTGEHLEAMLSQDPAQPESADRALEHAGSISAYLFGEAKDHLLEIEELWETEVEERLAALGTPESPQDE
jgi:hypothetical protein